MWGSNGSGGNGNNRNNNQNNNNDRKQSPWSFISIVLWALLLVMVLNNCNSMLQSGSVQEVRNDEFYDWVEKGYVESVEMTSNEYYFTLKPDSPPLKDLMEEVGATRDSMLGAMINGNAELDSSIRFVTAYFYKQDLIDWFHENGVEFDSERVTQEQQMISALISVVLPIVVMVVALLLLYRYMFKNMGAGGIGGIGGVGKANAKVYVEKKTGVTFRDVAGQDEAKESLEEIIDFLHNPGKYTEIGAKLPKGALLVGPPGTGKTLLAKAVAGEANVPFFSISGSDFVEMFVGVGASRVRDLFKEATKMAPCIIFIDEIDTIGKTRDNRMGGNDEREQTLNQLLSELDGFDPGKGVIVLGATNRPEVLDKALLRPGRFDRRITVDRPNLAGRLATLQVHTRKIHLAEDVDLKKIALATAGCVGADLANLVNEAALRAVRHGRKAVNQQDLLASFEFVIAGSEKKNSVLTEQEKKLVAYHEVGHAMVAYKQKHAEPVQKITIVPHTEGSLGYTLLMPEEDKTNLRTKEELMAEIAVNMGGRAAEEVVMHTMTNGASQDIQQATNTARNMVAMFGMSEEFGMMALGSVRNQYLDGGYGLDCAQDTAAVMDRAVKAILDVAYKDAVEILKNSREDMDKVVAYLLEKETITGGEMVAILEGRDPALVEDAYASTMNSKGSKPTQYKGDIEPPARSIHITSEPIPMPASNKPETGEPPKDEKPAEPKAEAPKPADMPAGDSKPAEKPQDTAPTVDLSKPQGPTQSQSQGSAQGTPQPPKKPPKSTFPFDQDDWSGDSTH